MTHSTNTPAVQGRYVTAPTIAAAGFGTYTGVTASVTRATGS
ncbi:hypothetical protein [Subtercola boreus]|nr:hypothetical protein [Subtercola boreus]